MIVKKQQRKRKKNSSFIDNDRYCDRGIYSTDTDQENGLNLVKN